MCWISECLSCPLLSPLSAVPLCKHINLLLFISTCEPVFGENRKGTEIGRLPHFLTLNIPHNSSPVTVPANVHLQSRWAIFAPFHSHVQHSQPPVKLIGSTSFQGHTITPTSQALLHEYIEERFPATLLHDWIPKDERGGGENIGDLERELKEQEQGAV